MHVGTAIADAMARAEEHQRTSVRRLRVRFMTQWGDDRGALTIVARFPARSDDELEAQQDQGVRRVPWADLDARAGELASLVDEAVAEVEAALGIKAEA